MYSQNCPNKTSRRNVKKIRFVYIPFGFLLRLKRQEHGVESVWIDWVFTLYACCCEMGSGRLPFYVMHNGIPGA